MKNKLNRFKNFNSLFFHTEFDNQKKTVLSKLDKSKKGSFDEDILFLINKINNSKKCYTTSSCSGRVVIIEKRSLKKNEAEWLLTSHKKVTFSKVKKVLASLPKGDIYFKFEPFIMHIAAKTIEDGQEIVNKAREIGFRRSGIQSTKTRVIVEIASTEVVDKIIAKKGKLLITEEYLKELIKEANSKMERNKSKIDRFAKIL